MASGQAFVRCTEVVVTIRQDERNGSTAPSEPKPPAPSGDDDAITSRIRVAKQRSAKLLRDAVDRLAWRIGDH
jgi:hypothetical protein